MAHHDFEFSSLAIETTAAELTPEPTREWYVLIGGRRFPPKQILEAVTGLDRADFTTHQARRIWQRLGFGVHRLSKPTTSLPAEGAPERARGPHGGAEARRLRPFAGQWVALVGTEVIFADADPRAVVEWLRTHDRRADAVFRVPAHASEIGSAMSQPL
ncbi:MAG: hypothetical protein ABWZ15_13080 [Acidimicrobiia bacterium]